MLCIQFVQETAINIGISAGLVSDASRCLVCNADSVEAATKRLAELTQRVRTNFASCVFGNHTADVTGRLRLWFAGMLIS